MFTSVTHNSRPALTPPAQKFFCQDFLGVRESSRGETIAAAVYASRDWHPAVTTHFKPYGGLWPAHCVQGADGACFHPGLRLPVTAIVITKGESPDSPGYSASEGHTAEGKPFLGDLRERGIRHLYVGGLATDYCVKHSVLDALSAGLRVTVLEDAIAGVDREDSARALKQMRERGAQVVMRADLFVGKG
jgi:nicotinamidase/pyrazinamidase